MKINKLKIYTFMQKKPFILLAQTFDSLCKIVEEINRQLSDPQVIFINIKNMIVFKKADFNYLVVEWVNFFQEFLKTMLK